ISLLVLIATVARPNIAYLGRIPGTRRFSDVDRHPDNETIPGVLIFRVEGSLLYFNADYVHDMLWTRIAGADSLKLVICDLSNSPFVDVAGATMLAKLHAELTSRRTALRIVEAHARVRDLLRAEGLEEQVGYLGRHLSVEQAIAEAASTNSSD